MSSSVISDSACLISLHKISRLTLLKELYKTVYIPEAVAKEFGFGTDWLEVRAVQNHDLAKALMLTLGKGEAEAIALAVELPGTILILDDHQARQAAKEMGLELTGTIGMLLKGKQAKILEEIRPVLDELKAAGFHMSDTLYEQAIILAAEK